jgi:hypothetical protein
VLAAGVAGVEEALVGVAAPVPAAAGGAESTADELPVDAPLLAAGCELLTGTAGVAADRQSSRPRPEPCPACSREPPAWRNAENKSCKNACKSAPNELAGVLLELLEAGVVEAELVEAGLVEPELGVLVVLAVAAGEVAAVETVAADEAVAAAGTVAVEVALDAAVPAAGAAGCSATNWVSASYSAVKSELPWGEALSEFESPP